MVLIPLGFPIALALALLFELTPEGLKRTVDIPPDKVPDIVRQLEAQARQQFVRGYLCALVYAGLGDKTEAIDYLKREYLNREEIDTTGILVDPMRDPLRCDPWLETPADKSPEITRPRRPMLMSTLLTGNGLPVLQPTEGQRIEIRSMP